MSDTAYLSVIVSGVVAIGSLIISPVINLIIERAKWKKENKEKIFQRLYNTTIDLLNKLQYFSMPSIGQAEQMGEKSYLRSFGELQRDYFSWEMAIKPYCKEKDNEILNNMRGIFLGNPHDLSKSHPDLTNQIIEYSSKTMEMI